MDTTNILKPLADSNRPFIIIVGNIGSETIKKEPTYKGIPERYYPPSCQTSQRKIVYENSPYFKYSPAFVPKRSENKSIGTSDTESESSNKKSIGTSTINSENIITPAFVPKKLEFDPNIEQLLNTPTPKKKLLPSLR